jgi:hypothetical protein
MFKCLISNTVPSKFSKLIGKHVDELQDDLI